MRPTLSGLYSVFPLLLVLLAWNDASAVDISFRPRVETGLIHYTFESEGLSYTLISIPSQYNSGHNSVEAAFEFADVMPYVGVGGTFFYNHFFLDVGGQYAFHGNDSTPIAMSTRFITSIDEDPYYVNTAYAGMEEEYKADFDRREMAISLGYALTSNFSVYMGYKWAETAFDTQHRGQSTQVMYDSDEYVRGKAGFDVWGHAQFRFKYSGPFMGATHGWDFSRFRLLKGTLTGSLALAYLKGKVELEDNTSYMALRWINDQRYAGEAEAVEGDHLSPRLDTKGDTLALTLGVGWSGDTAIDGLTYYLGTSAYRYEFDTERKVTDDSQSNINETAFLYKVGLAYNF